LPARLAISSIASGCSVTIADGPHELRMASEVLETFEARADGFDPHEVAEAVRTLAREWEAAGKTVTHEMRAEWLAFTLIENYRGDEGFTWGTYYGPMAVLHDAQGTRIEQPGIEEISPEVIAHWQARAHTARHPLLRTRYGDLVWEFGRRAKLAPGPEFPRGVIDATLVAAEKKIFTHPTGGFTCLRRALAQARVERSEA
jgi:hypothetical protein